MERTAMRDVKERWKGVKGRKSVKSDVDALKFDGEALQMHKMAMRMC